TGVMIGGKPAARMGDSCAHGGVIMGGCPTVLIGEAGGGGGGGGSVMPVNIMMKVMESMPPEVKQTMQQMVARTTAAESGCAFVHDEGLCPSCGKVH
ncbi:MAG: hypothetical protein ABI378_06165, partial [Chitinophagaceae bacterium]